MNRLAIASLRHRATASTATFLTVLLGTVLMGSFATLAQTATGPVSDVDHDTLFIMGAVVGSWGALIVLFAVVSTVGITVTQRETEIGLLREAVDGLQQTVVMVTHDPVAASYADRVVFLADGRVVDRMDDPTAERVADRMTHLGD